MAQQEILFAGFGGQGILSMGKFLAYAGMDQDMNVSWCPSYGPEMRGGTANCSVILSDSDIGSPIVTAPDTLVVMNRPSLEKFVDTLKPGGLLILDSDLISEEVQRDDVTVIRIPSQTIAAEIGSKTIANMVLLGALVKKTGIVGVEDLLKALKDHGKAKFYTANEQAVSRGTEFAN
ncbi:2-oxoglutarate oxidoreductase, gamma subunit [Clostridiaceae bacterium JG1575]|nr:2-oxoglutarate oxidoreductase, gamma subunit [Clostridiaceae bacterium JG1575]